MLRKQRVRRTEGGWAANVMVEVKVEVLGSPRRATLDLCIILAVVVLFK